MSVTHKGEKVTDTEVTVTLTWKTWKWVTRLHEAIVKTASVREIDSLVSEGVDVNQADEFRDGKTPLHLAALSHNVNVVKRLLEAGAEIDAKDRKRHTALHDAALRGNVDIMLELLKVHGVEKNAVDVNRETPLHFATANGRISAVKLLKNAGSDLSIRNKRGLTAQEMARNDRLHLESIRNFPGKQQRVAELEEVEEILEETEYILEVSEKRIDKFNI